MNDACHGSCFSRCLLTKPVLNFDPWLLYTLNTNAIVSEGKKTNKCPKREKRERQRENWPGQDREKTRTRSNQHQYVQCRPTKIKRSSQCEKNDVRVHDNLKLFTYIRHFFHWFAELEWETWHLQHGNVTGHRSIELRMQQDHL